MHDARQPQIVVAGHICLDVIPSFPNGKSGVSLMPGSLTRIGPAVCSTGGAVANVGRALDRLGVPVTLIGRIGEDLFGRGVQEIIAAQNPRLIQSLRVISGETTSYTVVINPPGSDRFFLHCPGANDTFTANDIDEQLLDGAKLFHFGYPPIMRSIYRNDGRELQAILALARRRGLTTSLDMASVEPESEAGSVDWARYMANVLPLVDVFVPSVEELLFMLDRPRWERLMQGEDRVDGRVLRELSTWLLERGTAVVLIKLGSRGVYLRTTDNAERLKVCGAVGFGECATWRNRELVLPCFKVEVAGTTGAGDCTIAGFLAALLRCESPEQAAEAAVAVGACSVERLDATSGVKPWTEIEKRIAAGWERQVRGVECHGS